ncbi:MAG: RecX family transcriptional regulator [Dehalococcoidia bacterium]|nr:RecX family transcriptional regulator [Dehalococcoidia bacterium]
MDEPPAPPRIIDVRSAGRGRHRLLVLDDGREFVFSDEACDTVGIDAGKAATEELFEELDAAEQRVSAHEAALRLLSNRARSAQEMRTRLAMRGIAPDTIEDEITRLQRAGLLDDEKFARAWVEDRKRTAPRGRRMLRYELLGRGIEPESVDLVTRDIDDLETAVTLARGKARGSALESWETFFAKVGGFLQRRGFDYGVCAEATRRVWGEITGTAAPATEFAE